MGFSDSVITERQQTKWEKGRRIGLEEALASRAEGQGGPLVLTVISFGGDSLHKCNVGDGYVLKLSLKQ